MKCKFYLLDVSEHAWEGQPGVRFWGIDESGGRVLIQCNLIMPYFYYLPGKTEDVDRVKEEVARNKKAFPKVLNVTTETKKLLGHERQVLKITCMESGVRGGYVSELGKIFGKGQSFEHDLRLSVRYITDLMLKTSGWNECDVDKIDVHDVTVDRAYVATSGPIGIADDKFPNLRVLAVNTLTAGEKGSARAESDPVRAIALITSSGKSATLHSEREDDSELLRGFVEFVNNFDPDLIVGFECSKLDWPYLIQRAKLHNIKLSVGRDASEPHTSVYGHISVTGRANLDLSDVAGSLTKVKVKTLENIAKYLQLHSANRFKTIDEWDRFGLWKEEGGRRQLMENAMGMAHSCLELAQSTLQFPIQLSRLTGLPLDHVVAAAVGFRVDSYLVIQAHRVGELIPTRNDQPYFTYQGALVVEPKTGLHENVAVLDFASMYPALMKKYNLSPDTLVQSEEQVPEDSVFVIPEVNHRFRKSPDGFYRTVLATLISERSSLIKKLEEPRAESTEFKVLKDRERAVKLVTNACYGYAGWAGARWYAREVAESAAALGRETITKTIEKAKSIGLAIIYSDTDSIFVTNETAKIQELLDWAKTEFENIEIRVERVYSRILFTEAMKRYAGLLSDGSLDIVGLEVVRGDWSDIARHVQEQVIKEILIENSIEKAIEVVRATVRRLRIGDVPMAELTIRKTLTKPIERYAVRAPHVEVAKRLMKEGWKLAVGDKVAYVIVKGPGSLYKKASPFNQVKSDDVDIEYYLDNQVRPAAMRILERFGVKEKQVFD